MPNDKPHAAELRWQIEERTTPYENETLKFRVDRVRLRDGAEKEYGYIERSDAVIIVPLTRESEVITLRQYRYPADDWCVEVPAGGTHDTGDESLADVARQELREEVGATEAALTYIGFFYSAPSLSNEKCHVYLAENVEVTTQPDMESGEEIKIKLMAADEVLALARSGKMKNSPCALAVLLCEPLLRERGYTS